MSIGRRPKRRPAAYLPLPRPFFRHLAIAKAAGNPHVPQFLEAVGRHITTDLMIKHSRVNGSNRRTYLAKVSREHGAILAAITQGHTKTARTAVRQHLEESMVRYRRLLA